MNPIIVGLALCPLCRSSVPSVTKRFQKRLGRLAYGGAGLTEVGVPFQWSRMDAMLKLRPVDPDDEPFLRELRAQVDVERLGLQYWSPDELPLAQKIVDLQFKAHAAHYRTVKNNWDTKDCVIELNGRPVGRFIVTQDSRVVHLADIAVHAAFRGMGLGHAVIETTKAECEQSKRILRLHVDPMNPALQLYVSLGFKLLENKGTVYLMEWVPPSLQGKTMYFGPTA